MQRTHAILLATLVLGLGGVVAARPNVRASFRAGARAFVDPSLIERPAQPSILDSGACGPVVDGAVGPAVHIIRDFDPVPADQNDPDAASLRTLVMPDLSVPITRRTLHFVKSFTKGDRGRRVFLERFRRAGKYRPIVEGALREAGLPEDLVWVAAVESGFDPTATSVVGAAGLWQLMPETGTLYGLDQSAWHDERRNVLRSTAAAATHLRDLHERFGRWDLALAAYNAGFDTVLHAMEKFAKARAATASPDADAARKPIEFADLAGAGLLPPETSSYVPQVMAFAIVATNRSRFSLDGADLAAFPALEPAELAVPQGTRLRTVARAAGVPLGVLRDYNPQLLRDRVPPTGGDYVLYLPNDRISRASATFVAYQQAETLADVEEEPAAGPLAPPRLGKDAIADDEVEKLPARPRHLGKNRLPAFEPPGREIPLDRTFAALGGSAPRLPAAGLAVGWQVPLVSPEDPFGMLKGNRGPTKLGGAMDKATAFLEEIKPPAPVGTFSLGSGIEVRFQREKSLDVQIAVRIATGNVEPSRWLRGDLAKPRTAPDGEDPAVRFGMGETIHVAHVNAPDLEVALAVAAARARALLAEGSDASIGSLRRVLLTQKRKTLEAQPGGAAQVALFDAMFPAGHVLHGTLPGRADDPVLARDLSMVETLAAERNARRVTITVRGDVGEGRVRAALEANLPPVAGLFGAREAGGVGLLPKEERVRVEGTEERVLVGYSVPRLALRERAALLYALEILGGKYSRLGRGLVAAEDCAAPAPCEKMASKALSHVESGALGGAAWIELAATGTKTADDLAKAYDDVLRAFDAEGPTQKEMFQAHFWLKFRLDKESGRSEAQKQRGELRTFTGTFEAHLRELFSPSEMDDLIAELPKVQIHEVQKAARRLLGKDHRVVLTVSRAAAHLPSAAAHPPGGLPNSRP